MCSVDGRHSRGILYTVDLEDVFYKQKIFKWSPVAEDRSSVDRRSSMDIPLKQDLKRYSIDRGPLTGLLYTEVFLI